MKLFKEWTNLNYPGPIELQTTLNLTESETYEFFKSLRLKKNKVNKKIKNENTMKKNVDIEFNTEFINLSD